MFSFEKLPVWGRYPHNFILDSLGNLGLILMLLSLISSVLIFFNFYTSIVPGKNNSLGLSFSALALSIIIISSLISGSLWDYFSIFSGLAFLPISFPLSRVKSQ
jgi:O-antigen ligase